MVARSSQIKLAPASCSDGDHVTMRVPVVPGPPQSVGVDAVQPHGFVVSWQPPLVTGGSAVTQYIVVMREQSKTKYKKVGRADSATCRLAVASHVEPDREYHVRVYAENAVGIGGVAGEPPAPVRTPAPSAVVAPDVVPECPTALTVDEVTENGIRISWAKSDDDAASAVTGYVVAMRDGEKKKFKDVGKVDGGVTSFRVKRLKAGHEYDVRVYAENAVGLSERPAELARPVRVGAPVSRCAAQSPAHRSLTAAQ